MIKLIVGLGNPGKEYLAHRHNAGFWFVDRLAKKLGSEFGNHKYSNILSYVRASLVIVMDRNGPYRNGNRS